ncbi:hypothetical protein [Vibrio phage vB_pir03]|nr:hypothetical protein [Vibrio phage vB_pir03]
MLRYVLRNLYLYITILIEDVKSSSLLFLSKS